jgi:DNA-binding response OmpR family regulator
VRTPVGEPDVAVSRGALMSDMWDENWFGSTKTLDMHVAALRRKLTAAAAAAGVAAAEIVTLRAHGFRLQTPPPPAPAPAPVL